MKDLEPTHSFVAREAEVEALTHHLDSAFKSAGKIVLVYGEAGIGKTSLVNVIAKQTASSGRVLIGRCLPHNLSPYLVFVDALEELFEMGPEDSRITRGKKFSRTIENLGIRAWLSGPKTKGPPTTAVADDLLDDGNNLSIIRDMMRAGGETQKGDRELRPENKARRDWLFESVLELLRRSSRREPILMILEDLHWADPSSLALLHYLARNVAGTRTLILGTYRTEELVEAREGQATLLDILRLMRREDLLEEVPLDRLKHPEMVELLQSALQGYAPPDLAKLLYRETEGNPLFVTEVLRLLIQEKLLMKTDGSWSLNQPVERLKIPVKVHEVISRRLDRLPTSERDVLDCSSVVGEVFDSQVLGSALKIERAGLVRILSDLERRHGLIHYSKGEYRFDHSKVREVLYQEMGDELRMNYHLEIAENLAKHRGDRHDPSPSVIAFHYKSGGDDRKALEHYLKAAEAAKNKLAFEESILHLNEALKTFREEEVVEKVRALEDIGDLYEITGKFSESTANWRRAIQLLEAKKDEPSNENLARLHRKIASALQVRGELAPAFREIESGIQTLRDESTVEGGWLRIVSCKAKMLLEKWEEAREDGNRALRIFQDNHMPLGEAQALEVLGRIEMDSPRGETSTAEKSLAKALDLSRSIGDIEMMASVHTELARLFAYHFGNIDKAMEQIGAIEKLPGTLRNPHKLRALLMLRGWINLKVKGDFEAAKANFGEALLLAQKIEDPHTLLGAKFGQANVAYYQGKFSDARRLFEECVPEYKAQRRLGYAVESIWMRGECCLLEGDLKGFQSVLAGIEDPDLQPGLESRPILALTLKGLKLFLAGDREGSQAAFSKAVERADSGPEVEQSPSAHYVYGVVLRAIGDPRQAKEQLDHAATLLQSHHREGILSMLQLREELLTKTLSRAEATLFQQS